jgi:RNA polymerase sigma-70 factor (ECF subfamily)
MIGPDFQRRLEAAQRGDEDAFSQLWRDANPVLLRYLHVVAGPAFAEDVASDTWLHVVRGLAAFRGDERAWRAWLVTLARRRAVDAGRLRQRNPSVAWQQGDEPPPAADAESLALARLDTQAALELVATLPPQQAEAVVLRVIVGLEPRQVAELLGTTSGAVRVAVHRGLKRLAQQLG